MKNPGQFLSELKSAGLLRVLRNVDCLPGGMARMEDGREVVNLASNDYLGLAHHPALAGLFPVRRVMAGPGPWLPAWSRGRAGRIPVWRRPWLI